MPQQLQADPVPAPHSFSLPGRVVPNGNPAVKQEPGFMREPPKAEPRIKQEPSTTPHGINVTGRVIENLQNKFGDGASASIQQIRTISDYKQPQGQPPEPGNPMAQSQQYRHAIQARTQQHLQQMQVQQQQEQAHPHQNTLGHDQADGAADMSYEGLLMRGNRELGRFEVDRLLHSRIAAAGREMEGGGFMVPLKCAPKGTTKTKRAPYPRVSSTAAPHTQLDGAMDDDDDDAINSDLDDSDDIQDSEEEDDEGGNVMLCVYDKVQRVKNKW